MRTLSTRAAGLLILIGGLWGGLAPFIGPYFHFTLGPDHAWRWTSGRLWLDVLPGAVAALGGLILLGAGPRLSGRAGALMALAAGVWFAVGPDVSQLWHTGGAQGAPHGSTTTQAFESIAFHTGLGALMAALAGYALPGALIARRHRKAAVAEGAVVGAGAGAIAEHEHDKHREEREAERERVLDRERDAEPAAANRSDAPVGAGGQRTTNE